VCRVKEFRQAAVRVKEFRQAAVRVKEFRVDPPEAGVWLDACFPEQHYREER
jgi:hypothetical protein